MPRDDLYTRFVERNIEQIARCSRKRHDVGPHPRGLGVDIDPDNRCVWHCHGCTGDETSLGTGASGAVDDRGRSEAQLRGLRFDLGNRRRIGDRAERVRDPVWHEVRLMAPRIEIINECANGCIAVTGPRHVMEMRAEQPIEKRVARVLVFRRRRLEPAVIDGKMARQPELCRNRRNLPLAVRLHDAARDDRIGAV
jgi:hypothetical protein